MKNFSPKDILISLTLLFLILFTAVLAFDPIEYKNKSRDEQYKKDSESVYQLVKSYNTSVKELPWVSGGLAKDNSEAFGYINFKTPGVGICAPNCTFKNAGPLVTFGKSSDIFEKEFMLSSLLVDQVFIGKATGVSAPHYICFIPLSKYVKEKAIAEENVWILGEDGERTNASKDITNLVDWEGNKNYYTCIP